MTLNCPTCGTTNRIPSIPSTKIRCGKCQHVFTPLELSKARPEVPPKFELQQQDDINPDEPYFVCKDEDNCGWEGYESELDDGKCPECGRKCRREDE